MYSLLDLMRAAQGGAIMNNMARQFGLSVEQTQRAVEALMPAFALGFQRRAADPTGFADILRMMGSGQYARFFDHPAQAFTPAGRNEGNAILEQLFGRDVSRQIAEQTAAWAGIAPDIMKQMLPAVAPVLMGGLFRSAANEGLADYFEQLARMLRGETGAARPESRRNSAAQAAPSDPFTFWTTMMGTMAGARPQEPAQKPGEASQDQGPHPFGPWGEMMSAMLGAGRRPAPEPPPPPEPPPRPNPFEFLARTFETGRELQEQQLATLQNIFDTYWGAGAKRDGET